MPKKGYKQTSEHKAKIIKNLRLGAHNMPHTSETKEKIRQSKLGCPQYNFGGYKLSEETKKKISISLSGGNHYRWIKDRSQLKQKQERNDSAYQYWRLEVYKRDNYKCRISNQDCKGRIEAHHILGFGLYPELRYVINNGITVCHYHHPRKKKEELNMIPVFQELLKG